MSSGQRGAKLLGLLQRAAPARAMGGQGTRTPLEGRWWKLCAGAGVNGLIWLLMEVPERTGTLCSLFPSLHASACLSHQRKALARSGCFYSCVLWRNRKLSSGTGSSIPPFQTPRDVSKIQEDESCEIPLKKLHSKQALINLCSFIFSYTFLSILSSIPWTF
ncbi:hypothetical protein GQ55_1G240700 [Panicum hallii var. hallii]|uniref:Uncharacterized protein n=1 Tax=Panicum hallii var. hallii TaxID=1504633 RepID=A0A2T7F6Y4_9POAL|nr:hypothetical protein GQ55_1G240700 [Panicum hallii var. hallii]